MFTLYARIFFVHFYIFIAIFAYVLRDIYPEEPMQAHILTTPPSIGGRETGSASSIFFIFFCLHVLLYRYIRTKTIRNKHTCGQQGSLRSSTSGTHQIYTYLWGDLECRAGQSMFLLHARTYVLSFQIQCLQLNNGTLTVILIRNSFFLPWFILKLKLVATSVVFKGTATPDVIGHRRRPIPRENENSQEALSSYPMPRWPTESIFTIVVFFFPN